MIVTELSTPSLGITGSRFVFATTYLRWLRFTFNSLSRDHTFQTKHVIFTCYLRLSTPSLGITEPDSGIFRLSAAFCRGAPSHK
jgi:hypothetical protein